MSRPKAFIPRLCHHKGTNQAVVYLDGKQHYLGVFGSPQAGQRYGELVAKLHQSGLQAAIGTLTRKSAFTTVQLAPAATVGDLCLRFIEKELPKYAHDEQHCLRGAIRVLASLFGEVPAAEFGPQKLDTVRHAMVLGDPHAVDKNGKSSPRRPWSRSYINKQVKRIKYIFRCGVEWEMVPQAVRDAISALRSLEAGETDAAESRPRHSISDDRLKAVREELGDRNRDLFDLMLLTGARPGELIGLTTGIIDRSGEVWKVELVQHKTAHKGKERKLFFNATAQAIMQKYLRADPDVRLFSIRRSTFGTAVKEACERAFEMPLELRSPPKELTAAEVVDVKARAKAWRQKNCFTPHWLRHTTATRLADDIGLEAAQRLLGHSQAAMTEHYSRKAERVAIEAAKRLG